MTAKEKLVERLKALGAQLGRDVNVTGTIEELTMRIPGVRRCATTRRYGDHAGTGE